MTDEQMDDIENIRSCYIERRKMQTHDPRIDMALDPGAKAVLDTVWSILEERQEELTKSIDDCKSRGKSAALDEARYLL